MTVAGPSAMPPARRPTYLLLAALLVLDVTTFILEKIAAERAAAAAAGNGGAYYLALTHQVWFWMSLALGPLQLLTWTRILGSLDLSLAYPITSLAYPLTMLTATVLLRESLSPSIWVGAMLITVGVAMIGERDRENAPPASIK